MIGVKTVETIKNQVEQLLNDYLIDADGAFDGEDGLAINFKAKISPTQDLALIVETSIAFVTGRVKDKSDQKVINEVQSELPFDEGGGGGEVLEKNDAYRI